MLTAAILDARLPHAPHSLVDGILASWSKTCEVGKLVTPLEQAHFMAQTCEETGGFTAPGLQENLHYSATRMHQVWPSRFPTIASAEPYVNNPRALADKVYGGREGNRPGTDDGWNFRGRGPIQITFRNLYLALSKICGIDLIANPDAACAPDTCMIVAAAYWQYAGVNKYAAVDNIVAETRLINGALTNLAARESWLKVWKPVFGLKA
jgi:putative chitinase